MAVNDNIKTIFKNNTCTVFLHNSKLIFNKLHEANDFLADYYGRDL